MFVGQVQQRDVVEKISVTEEEVARLLREAPPGFTTPSESRCAKS